MRGGVSYINKGHSKASKNANILYLDVNNLYGYVMSQSILSESKTLIKSNKN